MKPNTRTAMEGLIKEVREKMPFGVSSGGHCEGRCDECPEKLLEFLDMDLCDWEFRLKKGDVPTLADVHGLAVTCKEIHSIMVKKGLVQELHTKEGSL